MEYVMTLNAQNQTLIGILDHLARHLGSTTLDLTFEDFGLHEAYEPYFDGMCLWALNEGLVTVMSASNLDDAHTRRSYAHLHNPAITSLGVMVASLAMEHLDGNVVLATALTRHRGLSGHMRGDWDEAEILGRLVSGQQKSKSAAQTGAH
jgi:hypothetical protein